MPAVLLIAVNNLSFSLSCCCCSELVMAEGGPSKDMSSQKVMNILDSLKQVQEFAKKLQEVKPDLVIFS